MHNKTYLLDGWTFTEGEKFILTTYKACVCVCVSHIADITQYCICCASCLLPPSNRDTGFKLNTITCDTRR